MSYDLNGNALGVNAFALTYDAENRLATATSGSAVESYSYDESNHRLEKIFGTSDYLYFYGPGGKLLSIRQVTGGTTSVVADRVYFGGLLLGSAGAMGSQDVSTLADRLGTAATGYPYGTNRGNAAGNDQPDFATYTKDATTGFEYANQRYYSAGLGRFITADPFWRSVSAVTPISWNRYAYSWGDPVNSEDPTGLCVIDGVEYADGLPPCPDVTSDSVSGGYDLPYVALDTSLTGDSEGRGSAWKASLFSLFSTAQTQARLAGAASVALTALKGSECAGLYGTSDSRNNGWDPTDVLNGLLDPDGSKFGSIGFVGLLLPVKALTFIVPGSGDTDLGVPPAVAILINTLNVEGSFTQDSDFSNAVTLLHELGHLFSKLSPYGSGGSKIKNDSLGIGSGSNDQTIIENCFTVNLKAMRRAVTEVLLLAVLAVSFVALFCNVEPLTSRERSRQFEELQIIMRLKSLSAAQSRFFGVHGRYGTPSELFSYEKSSGGAFQERPDTRGYRLSFFATGNGYLIRAEPVLSPQKFVLYVTETGVVRRHAGGGPMSEADPSA